MGTMWTDGCPESAKNGTAWNDADTRVRPPMLMYNLTLEGSKITRINP